MKKCDHHAVGIIARNEEKILMIQRRGEPYGFGIPARHLDNDNYPKACVKEFREITGLRVVGAPKPVPLPELSRRDNKCERGGDYHFWQIFEVQWEGELAPNTERAIGVGWISIDQIKSMGEKTKKYLDGEVPDGNWMIYPGLEPLWYKFFKELKII